MNIKELQEKEIKISKNSITAKGENMQCCVIDGYYAFAFKNPLDLPMTEESKFTFSKVLPDYSNFDKVEHDIAEIKTTLKLHKAEKKKEKCTIEINKKCYDAQYFINVIEALGNEIRKE